MKIIKRIEWDKDFTPEKAYTKHTPRRIVMHHSYLPTKAQYVGVETVRAIRNHHVVKNGWNDIGYHYIVSPSGRDIFEGRPDNVVGAHCGGHIPFGVEKMFGNTGSIGILLIGNYDTEELDEDGIIEAMELVKLLGKKHDISLEKVYGHCHSRSKPHKSCPGKNLFIRLFGKNEWIRLFGTGK